MDRQYYSKKMKFLGSPTLIRTTYRYFGSGANKTGTFDNAELVVSP